jgi:hypothetical protein
MRSMPSTTVLTGLVALQLFAGIFANGDELEQAWSEKSSMLNGRKSLSSSRGLKDVSPMPEGASSTDVYHNLLRKHSNVTPLSLVA